jgi:hypothetical protein
VVHINSGRENSMWSMEEAENAPNTTMQKVQRSKIVTIITCKLTELCDANGADTADCEQRARVDEEFLYAHSSARNNNLYVSYVAEYLAIVEKCILMGWTYDSQKIH